MTLSERGKMAMERLAEVTSDTVTKMVKEGKPVEQIALFLANQAKVAAEMAKELGK